MSTSDQSANQSRVDPKTIQQWRDRQLRATEKPPSKAEKLAAEQKMVDLLNKPQRLTGLLSRPAASGGTVMVLLFKPYRGLTSIPAIAIDGCDTLGKVTLLKDKDDNWYAIGKGKETVRKDRDIERSSDPSKPSVTGEIAYCYSVFIQRRTATNQPYKWFWQVFAGGWTEENILVKEWEIPEDNVRNLGTPQAIVDFREGAFYVSLRYTVWNAQGAPPASQQRYALFKGTKKEDLETKWDKSTKEMLPSVSTLGLEPRGFGYWSSDVSVNDGVAVTTHQLWDGAITAYLPPQAGSNGTATIPQGWVLPSKEATYKTYPDSLNSDRLLPALLRIDENGANLLSAVFQSRANQVDAPTTYSETWNAVGSTSTATGTVDDFNQVTVQDRRVYNFSRKGPYVVITTITGTSGQFTNSSSVPAYVTELDMPEDGGNLPFMAKMADVGNTFTTSPAKPAIATGSVLPSITSLSPGIIPGAGSPYLADVHDKFISAIQCPDLLNRGTTETQNIYGDLTPIYPFVASAGDLTAKTGMESGVSFGVTSLSKVFTFNISSTATVDGTTVIAAAGGFGRWVFKTGLPANPATPDDEKLPGELLLSDIFPETKGAPPPPEWIGYKNIEHENRTVKVYLWKPELTTLFQEEPVEVEVQKIDAVKKIIDDETLQQLLSYTFFNASFG